MKRKLFFLLAFLAMIGMRASAQTNYEVGTRYTDLSALVSDGTLFTIVNETDQKALCFPVAQDMAYQSYDDAVTRNCYTFKLEASGNNYILRTYTASGDLYKAFDWANGYFNSQPADGTVCFTLNENQDIENGHVWALESDDAGKFAIKNIGTGKYLKDSAPAKYDDPTYFTLCTLRIRKAAFNALKSAADAIKNVEYKETTSGSHSTFESAIAAQQSAVDAATTAAQVNTAIEALKNAIKTYINGAEPKNEGEYFDITCLMTNPNFTGNADGWEGNPSYQKNNAEKFNTTFDVYQTVSDLPAGYYRVKAQAFDRQTDVGATYESPTSVSKAYLYAGNASKLVKRIYDDASTTQKNGDTDELPFTKGETTVYIPNMPGAGEKYFDAHRYQKVCEFGQRLVPLR